MAIECLTVFHLLITNIYKLIFLRKQLYATSLCNTAIYCLLLVLITTSIGINVVKNKGGKSSNVLISPLCNIQMH